MQPQEQGHDIPPQADLKPVADFKDRFGVTRFTMWRWVTVGRNPGPVKLKAWMLKEWMTTEAEVELFIQRVTAAKLGQEPPAIPTPQQKQSKSKATKAALQAAGLTSKR